MSHRQDRRRYGLESWQHLPCSAQTQIERVHREDQKRFRLFHARSPLGSQSLDANGRILEVNPAWLETLERIGLQLGIAVRRAFAEEALRHSEREKSLILNSMSEMFFYLDTDLRIQWTNKAVEDVLGLSTQQCRGRYCYEVQFQRRAPCDGCSLVTALQTGRPAEAEITCLDGSIRLLRSYPVLDDGGEIIGLVEFAQDVTERKRFEEALLESEQTYRTLVQSLPDIVMRFDRAGRHWFVSDNVERVVDFSAAQFIGRTHRELGFPEEHCQYWGAAIRRVFDSGAPFETEFTVEGPRGPATFNWRLTPELDARGVVQSVLSVSRDITERKKAEQRQAELLHVSRLSTLGQMASSFAPFFTTKADGLGIGLSISRSIIEAHRGQLWVDRGPGRGCTFVFTLPAVRFDSAHDPVKTGTGQ